MQIELIISFGIMALLQIIAIIKGDSTSAVKIEQKKQKIVNKLTKKHEKTQNKFVEEEKLLLSLKGDNENDTNSKN